MQTHERLPVCFILCAISALAYCILFSVTLGTISSPFADVLTFVRKVVHDFVIMSTFAIFYAAAFAVFIYILASIVTMAFRRRLCPPWDAKIMLMYLAWSFVLLGPYMLIGHYFKITTKYIIVDYPDDISGKLFYTTVFVLIPCISWLISIIVVIALHRIRSTSWPSGLCSQCGYPVSDFARCPECGHTHASRPLQKN